MHSGSHLKCRTVHDRRSVGGGSVWGVLFLFGKAIQLASRARTFVHAYLARTVLAIAWFSPAH